MLHMSCRPSELINIPDSYTAFCFDEACAYIMAQINDEKEIRKDLGNDKEKPIENYSKPSDFYNKILNK